MSQRDDTEPPATDTNATTARGVTPKRLYGVLAIAEMVTWAGLITALILRYGFDIHELTFPAGLAHGFVFVAYGATVIIVGLNQRWRYGLIAFGIVTAIVPFATLPFDRWLARRGRLDGTWRTERSDDPRDHTWVDAALRWFLRHPLLLAGIMVVAVVTVVTTLLFLGPPTQWGR